jgi:hypothetical protein
MNYTHFSDFLYIKPTFINMDVKITYGTIAHSYYNVYCKILNKKSVQCNTDTSIMSQRNPKLSVGRALNGVQHVICGPNS